MKFFIILILSSACTTSSQQVPGTIRFSTEDAKLRRDGISYSTSVIHQNPKYPDQHAESSVKVDLHTNRPKLVKPATKSNPPSYLRRPKVLPTYATVLSQSNPRQQYPSEQKTSQSKIVYSTIQSPTFAPQSQSFNVGYSVSFTGGPKTRTPKPFARQRLESAEIITGARKDVVQKPNSELEAEDFVHNALIDLKKQRLSGIKPKLYKYNNDRENDAKKFIVNLAPKTQQYLSYLGTAKPTSSTNFRQQQQQSPPTQQKQSQSETSITSWVNLSPTVEIYHSRELPQQTATVVGKEQRQKKSNKFDHAAAIQKSQGFDYTNALESQNDGNSEKNHLNLDQTYANFFGNGADNVLSYNTKNPLQVYDSIPVVPLGNVPISQKAPEQQDTIRPKFHVDMSLMRDPILTTGNEQNIPNDPRTITIPFDTSLLRAMQQKLTNNALNAAYNTNNGQIQVVQENTGIIRQPFESQIQTIPSIGQQYQTQPLQQTHQFDIYDNQQQQQQQQSLFINNDFDQFFDQNFDKMQSQESRYENFGVRYPKFNNNNNNNIRLKSAKDIDIDLRPPPMKIVRHRRFFLGKAN